MCNQQCTPATRHGKSVFVIVAFFVLALAAGRAAAHDDQKPIPLRDVSFDQKLGDQIPLGLTFHDESGNAVQLAKYFNQRKPMILSFVYLKCTDLCPLLLDGIVRSLRALSFNAGQEFELLTVSFDPSDTPALASAKKGDLLQQYGRPGTGNGWHFLTGNESEIRKLTDTVGFHYTYDPKTGEFGDRKSVV